MYERIFDFNKQRALFVEDIYRIVDQGSILKSEDLIEHQRKLAAPFIGFRETKVFDGPVVDVFQNYTRSQGLPWGVSFIVYTVNFGVIETLVSDIGIPIQHPLPNTPFVFDLKRLPSTEFPLAGDILVGEDCAWFISRSQGQDILGIGMFQKGKKHGIYEKILPRSEEDYIIDMGKVYKDFLIQLGEATEQRVLENVQS
jgi:hypothetical protein